MPKFYIPSYLKDTVKRQWSEIENLSLQLSKFIPFGEDKKGSAAYKPRMDEFGNRIHLPSKVLENYKIFYKIRKLLWESKLREYGVDPDGFLKDLRLKTKFRLIVGLGDESVYETSIRLHRNYGVPFIPGSALKGVAKHYAIYALADENHEILKNEFGEENFFKLAGRVQRLLEEPNNDNIREIESLSFNLNKKTINFRDLREIFGTQKREGSIIFFDAYPTYDCLKKRAENNEPILELDIMNPHYQSYYSTSEKDLKEKVEKAPGDWHSSTPIFFLTVPKGVEFQFAIAPRDDEGIKLLDKAKSILISALREFGVGAKTSLGYGRFKVVEGTLEQHTVY